MRIRANRDTKEEVERYTLKFGEKPSSPKEFHEVLPDIQLLVSSSCRLREWLCVALDVNQNFHKRDSFSNTNCLRSIKIVIGKQMNMKQSRTAFAGRHCGTVHLLEERQGVLYCWCFGPKTTEWKQRLSGNQIRKVAGLHSFLSLLSWCFCPSLYDTLQIPARPKLLCQPESLSRNWSPYFHYLISWQCGQEIFYKRKSMVMGSKVELLATFGLRTC